MHDFTSLLYISENSKIVSYSARNSI